MGLSFRRLPAGGMGAASAPRIDRNYVLSSVRVNNLSENQQRKNRDYGIAVAGGRVPARSTEVGDEKLMATTVLQAFMRANLIDLEGEDTRLEKLKEAATTLASEFGARPIKMAIPALLSVLREDARNPDDAFDATSGAIEMHWSTYHSVFRDGNALTLYRAVTLQALVEAIDDHPPLGTAIALLMRNFRHAIELGKLAPSIQLLIDAAEEAFKAERERIAPPAAAVHLAPAAMSIKFDRTKLTKRMDAAVGPHDRAGQACESPNPHWPSQGNPWSHEFSDRMTAILSDYVDGAMAEAAKLDAKNHQAVANSIAALAMIDPAVKRSTSLLWWRQALYSESAEMSYRRLKAADAIVHAVADLSSLLPDTYERAVDSFLAEAILALGLGREVSDICLFRGVSSTAISALADCLTYPSPTGLVTAAVLCNSDAGLVCTPSLPPEEWAVWLLRELMAIRAMQEIQKSVEVLDPADE